MAKITAEPKPVHPVVAAALRTAADLLEHDDERGRLLREMIPGFACKPGKGNHWRIRVRKFHMALVTGCLSEFVDEALKDVRRDLIQELGQKHDGKYFAVERETGKTARRKGEFHFDFILRTDSFQSTPLYELFTAWGPEETVEYTNRQIRERISEKMSADLDFAVGIRTRHPTQPSQPYAARYTLRSFWRLTMPEQPMLQHLGFRGES